MSTIDKLLIKGIRSFSPDNTHVITFYRPLTLVVGANGAGKTTIIECLKNVLTGDLPPNTRNGQSFIHDPKVSGQTETKGQIKLRFRTASGKDVVCIRSFQLTQKASKLEFKALESVLQTINAQTGEKVCLSYKCQDFEKEVPALMGVSKAILENVIFVHQDEANWPLSESAVLKKKFDDIFAATRYTKALDVMKKLHKERNNEIKMLKLKLENLQTLRDAALKIQASINSDQEQAETLASSIQSVEQKLSTVQSRIDALEEVVGELRRLQSEINFKDGERASLMKAKTEQYIALEEENEDSDEDLAKWKNKLHENLAKLEIDSKEKNKMITDANTKSTVLGGLITRAYEELGRIQGEEEAHRLDRKRCEDLLQELFAAYRLGNISISLDDEAIERCIERVSQRLEELQKDLEQLKDFNSNELKKMWNVVQEAMQRQSNAAGIINSSKNQLAPVKNRIQRLDTLLKEDPFVEEELKESDERIALLEEELRKVQRKYEEKDFDSVINQGRIEKQMLVEKIRQLREDKRGLERQSEAVTTLKSKKKAFSDSEKEIRKMMDTNVENFRQKLNVQATNPNTVKAEVEGALSTLNEAYEQLLEKSRNADRQEAHARTMAEESESVLSKQKSERDALKQLIEAKLKSIQQGDVGLEAYPTLLKDALDMKDVRQSQHDMADGMRRMFEPFERIARSAHVCPCCERAFTASEEDDFVRKQRAKRSTTAERLQDLAAQKNTAASRAQQLESLRPMFTEYEKLVRDVIPSSEKLVPAHKEEHEKTKKLRDEISRLVNQSKENLVFGRELYHSARAIDELCKVALKLREEVRELQNHIDSQAKGGRSADDVEEEIKNFEEKVDDITRRLDRVKEEQDDLKESLARCTRKKYDEDVNRGKIKEKLAERRVWIEELESLRKRMVELETAIETANEQLEPLSRETERQVQEYNIVKKQLEEEQDARQRDVSQIDKDSHALLQVWSRIQTYVRLNKHHDAENAKRKLSELHSQKEQEDKKRTKCMEDIQRNNELIQSQKNLEDRINENMRYRKLCADEQKCTDEIKGLEEKIKTIGNAADFEADLKAMMREKQKLLAEVSELKGTLGVYQSNIQKLTVDLKQNQYKDIKKRYRRQLIELKTTEMANKDLDRYYHALDRALMRFHTMKMEEINKIIKELWQQTYRGQDIDYIAIASTSDASDAGKTGRSYSYRVVMKSGDAELEMRGRCSAGQKVLAALIIRLALAETFCLNCGILALDEPTTNLDAYNSESFAASLLRIMEERRAQENFQLIVITHDERFAQLIGQRQLAEKYYRVSKDENQHSLIEVQDIFN